MLLEEELTNEIIGAAIEVHQALGPGLLESAYEECLCHELSLRRIPFQRQVDLPVEYKGIKLDCSYRMDLIVKDIVVVEVKAVQHLLPVHEAQLLNYLRLSARRVGLILNFNVNRLRSGSMRKILYLSVPPCLRGESTRSGPPPPPALHAEPHVPLIGRFVASCSCCDSAPPPSCRTPAEPRRVRPFAVIFVCRGFVGSYFSLLFHIERAMAASVRAIVSFARFGLVPSGRRCGSACGRGPGSGRA